MHNDAIRDPNARFLFGTGVMYSRLTTYTDGLYENEQIRAHHPVEDCLKYFKTHTLEMGDNPDMFHHTLVWTRYLTQIILTDLLLPAGSWMAVQMHCTREDWQSPNHPMVKHLLDRVNGIPNYIDQDHSCNSLCNDWGILPHDWQIHSRHGHQGAEGQGRFREHIAAIAEERNLWN